MQEPTRQDARIWGHAAHFHCIKLCDGPEREWERKARLCPTRCPRFGSWGANCGGKAAEDVEEQRQSRKQVGQLSMGLGLTWNFSSILNRD